MRSTVGIPSFPRKRWPKAKVGEDVNSFCFFTFCQFHRAAKFIR